MMFMAMDHNTLALHSWPHGVGRSSELAGFPVHRWNYTISICVRLLSHLCAPGFTFLLGVGVVLLTQSRRKRGWGAPRLAKHFAIRGLALTAVSALMGLVMSMGQIWLQNAVLVALAVDYTLAGFVWLGVEWIEGALGRQLDKVLPDSDDFEDEEQAPLLHRRVPSGNHNNGSWPPSAKFVARHTVTLILLVVFIVALWLNTWVDPSHGRCVPGVNPQPWPVGSDSEPADFWRFWVLPMARKHVMSGFPPLAWLSPAIFGLIYGKLVFTRSRPLTNNAMAVVNVSLGAVFALLFMLTRVLHFGNLTEDCLQIDHHPLQPGQNQYLQSLPAFFYTSKYTPDPAFIFYSLAGNFFLFALFTVIPDAFSRKWFKPLLAYGQSALFFYVVHFLLLMWLGSIWIAIGGHEVDFENEFDPSLTTGMDEWWAYWGNFFLAMGIMWPLCNWYGSFKRSKGPDSLWRFF
jgi:hypothetical protein